MLPILVKRAACHFPTSQQHSSLQMEMSLENVWGTYTFSHVKRRKSFIQHWHFPGSPNHFMIKFHLWRTQMKISVSRILSGNDPVSSLRHPLWSWAYAQEGVKGSMTPIKAVTPYNHVLGIWKPGAAIILCHLWENYSSYFAGSDEIFCLSILWPVCSFISLLLINVFLLNSC